VDADALSTGRTITLSSAPRDADRRGMEPIRHRDAEAHGFTSRMLRRSPHFVHPARGVAQPAATADDLATTCRALAAILPSDAVFTHVTSALLRGWWMPMLDAFPIVACTDGDTTHHDRRGVYVRRCDIPAGHRERIGDLAVASPEWTIVELAEHLALLDLVAVIDCALHLGHTTIDRIRATMRRGRRGVRVLRRALDLADGRSESWWETMLRLVHVLSGIAVDPQEVVLNAAGVEVARVDLRIRGSRRVAEYDGGDHRDRHQHQDDLRRDKALSRQGLERYGYIATEIIHAAPQIVRDAEDALGLTPMPSRAGLWLAEARQASLTSSGRAALGRRLDRLTQQTSRRSRRANPASGA
jgi:very-short-patch-repair endonuclease